jgi:hypothetical protein
MDSPLNHEAASEILSLHYAAGRYYLEISLALPAACFAAVRFDSPLHDVVVRFDSPLHFAAVISDSPLQDGAGSHISLLKNAA